MERFLNNLEDSLAEEQGFSTVGVALALLLSFALIFSAARVYEIESCLLYTSSCSWQIDLSGNEASEEVTVSISTEVKPLPLQLVISVAIEHAQCIQPKIEKG